MPDGFHHHRIWKAGWLVMLPASFFAMRYSIDLGLAISSGYFLGRWINNDADQMGVSHAEGLLVNEVPILGSFVFGWFSVYGSLMRRLHRNWITHFPGVSTLIRLVWLLWWFPFLYYFHFIQFQMWDAIIFCGVWLGLSCSDLMHFLSDLFFSKFSVNSKKFPEKLN